MGIGFHNQHTCNKDRMTAIDKIVTTLTPNHIFGKNFQQIATKSASKVAGDFCGYDEVQEGSWEAGQTLVKYAFMTKTSGYT